MMAKTHTALGLAAYGSALPWLVGAGAHPTDLLFGAAAAFMGSLAPDIDHMESKIGRQMWMLSCFASLMGHRTWTHSFVGIFVYLGLVAAGTLYLLPPMAFVPVATGLALGYIVHLLGDSLTRGGIPWFYPFSRRRMAIPLFTTGSLLEVPIMLAALFWAGRMGLNHISMPLF